MSETDTRLTIDLDALVANHSLLRRVAGAAEVAPVVKADGYGLGAAQVARRLVAEGAKAFFVARISEAVALRRALGPTPSIYVLDGCLPGDAARLLESNLIPVLNSPGQVRDWNNVAAPAALHIDTGMNRLGLSPDEAETLARASARPNITLVMSHLSCGSAADHPNNNVQLKRFTALRPLFPNARASLANSGGVFLGQAYGFDMVRPGICLYGGGPFGQADRRIATVATLEAPILQVREIAAGESIGYGAAFTASSPMRVAIVAAGYADGVLRAMSPRGYVWLKGRRRPLVGLVSMDLIAIDVTEGAAPSPGDLVEVLGVHAALDDVASASGSIAYEVLTRLSIRATRRYMGEAS